MRLVSPRDLATATIGDVLSYTLVVTAPANVALTAAHVDDAVPAGVAYDSTTSTSCAAAGGGSCSPDVTVGAPATGAGTVSWPLSGAGSVSSVDRLVTCALGDLVVGATRTITFSLTVPVAPSAAAPSYTNTATVTSDTPELPQDAPNDSSNWTTTVPYADVSITKGASSASVYPGGSLIYTLRVTNNGPSTATAVVVDDTLPPGLAPAGVAVTPATAGSCTITGSAVHCALGDRPALDLVTISLTASVDPSLTPQTLTNTASVAAANDYDPTNNSASASVAVTNKALNDVKIDKLLLTRHPVEGADAVYCLTVRNLGPNAAENLVVTDPLPSALDLRALALPDGVTCTGGPTVICQLGTLAAGETAPTTATAFRRRSARSRRASSSRRRPRHPMSRREARFATRSPCGTRARPRPGTCRSETRFPPRRRSSRLPGRGSSAGRRVGASRASRPARGKPYRSCCASTSTRTRSASRTR